MSRVRRAVVALAAVVAVVAVGLLRSVAAHAGDAPPPPTPAAPYVPPAVRSFHLDDGARVLVVERHDRPTVAVALASDVGAASAPSGVAALAVDAAVRGGPSFGAAPDEHSTTERRWSGCDLDGAWLVEESIAAEMDDAVVELAAESIHPGFPRWAFDDARSRRLTAIDRDEGDTRAAFAAVFPPEHPLHGGTLGTRAALTTASVDDVRAYWSRAFSRGHVTAIVVGDVTVKDALDRAGRALAELPSAPGLLTAQPSRAANAANIANIANAPVPPTPRAAVAYVARRVDLPHVVVAGPAPARSSADYWPLRVLAEVLAGGGSLTSRVFRSTRERHGYTYGIFAGVDSRRDDTGVFHVEGAVAPGHAAEAAKQVLADLQGLVDAPVSDAELARAEERLENRLEGPLETNVGLAMALADTVTRGLPFDFFAHAHAAIHAVTKEQVCDVARRWATPANMRVTLAGADVAALRAEASAAGL